MHKYRQRIKKIGKKMIAGFHYEDIEFSFSKMLSENNIMINIFGYKNKQTDPIYLSKRILKIPWNNCL